MSLVIKNIVIEARKGDNFINATQLCKAGGKKFKDWYRLDSTKELISELENNLKSDAGITASLFTSLIDVRRGNTTKYSQGSWIHPDLAAQLAQWISPKFAIQVSRWIRELFITGLVAIDSKKSDQELLKLREELNAKTSELETSKQHLLKLNEFVQAANELKKDEIFYIATTEIYAKNNRFEYGGIANIKDLNTRLAGYNTGRAEGDLFYYTKIIKCHRYKHIESCLDILAKGFKDKINGKKEMVHMRYDCFIELVEFIIENHNKDIDFINEHAARFINVAVEMAPIVPEPLDLKDYIIIKRRKNSEETEIQKIDVSEWTEEKINELIKNLINQYATVKLGASYDFDTQKNTNALQLIWKEFQKYLETYTGKNKIGWRDHIKSVSKNAQKLAIKWKS